MLINGHQLHVEQHGAGDGPVVVLLHHGLGSVRAWKSQIPALVQAGFRVLAYDRWGYGSSDSRPGLSQPFFSDDLADLRALFEQLGLDQVFLVGHSDGGTIALYYAAQHSRHVAGLVTVAAHVYVEEKMGLGIFGLRQAYEQDARFRRRMRRVHGKKAKSVFFHWFDGWTRPQALAWDMRPVLSWINCPALVMQGSEDEHATPQHARDIVAAIPHAELWLFSGAGHMLQRDHAGEFNEKLVDFLNRIAGRDH